MRTYVMTLPPALRHAVHFAELAVETAVKRVFSQNSARKQRALSAYAGYQYVQHFATPSIAPNLQMF